MTQIALKWAQKSWATRPSIDQNLPGAQGLPLAVADLYLSLKPFAEWRPSGTLEQEVWKSLATEVNRIADE